MSYKCPKCDAFYVEKRTCVGLPWTRHDPVMTVPVDDVPQPDTIAVVRDSETSD